MTPEVDPERVDASPDAADLAAGAAGSLLARVAQVEVAMLDEPHILVCTDAVTGVTTYTGPFANGYEAVASLEEYEAAQQGDPDCPTVTCTLAPLFPG
ncbi:hypothetical protein ACJ5H2_01270 [Nocardioides sp. R1-1]|uniref:hypothetical protein n=1 Tax=Nocardioides sp. R1-1 TaxID=3383502 RepID=UPI0038D12C32